MTLHSCGLITKDIRLDGTLNVGDEDEDEDDENYEKIYDWEWLSKQNVMKPIEFYNGWLSKPWSHKFTYFSVADFITYRYKHGFTKYCGRAPCRPGQCWWCCSPSPPTPWSPWSPEIVREWSGAGDWLRRVVRRCAADVTMLLENCTGRRWETNQRPASVSDSQWELFISGERRGEKLGRHSCWPSLWSQYGSSNTGEWVAFIHETGLAVAYGMVLCMISLCPI